MVAESPMLGQDINCYKDVKTHCCDIYCIMIMTAARQGTRTPVTTEWLIVLLLQNISIFIHLFNETQIIHSSSMSVDN